MIELKLQRLSAYQLADEVGFSRKELSPDYLRTSGQLHLTRKY
jgi:hypothetical protein